jgi:hypothetical protein
MIKYFLDDLGIVFYTNMVNYPNVLSAQVLPKELKILAVTKLRAVRELVPEFNYVKANPILLGITLGQIDGVINYLNAEDQSNLWTECLEFNRKLDATRSQDFFSVTPEFKKYV